MNTPRLRMAGVRKSFGATQALKGVDLELPTGKVLALIGENGAGKSTLMKILSGAHPADSGEILLDGNPFKPQNPLHASESGIAMIYQELNLAPHLNVEENILLGFEPHRFGWVNRTQRSQLAQAALDRLHHSNIPLKKPVNELTIAEQQIVEIARALNRSPRVLIMDEPTSSLTQVDAENLFQVIHQLKNQGVSIIYISHFLEECREVADQFIVLRDGETIASGAMENADLNQIIQWMVGREIQEIFPEMPHKIGTPVLKLEKVKGSQKPESVSLELRKGEILGIAGLVGSGRTETVRTLFGLDRLKQGRIFIDNKESSHSTPYRRLKEGMGLLSENRKEEGLMLNRSLADNLTATHFKPFTRFGFIRENKQRQASIKWMERLHIRADNPFQAIGELSGGNQQKVAIGRLLHHEAEILLLDEPTRGIDVASKAQIYRVIGELAAQGKAILFISSYLPELFGVCDTIGVMCRGTLTAIRPTVDWTETSLMAAAIGQESENATCHV